MPTYMLRGIDDALWAKVKARAARDGQPLRAVLITLLTDYASEEPGRELTATERHVRGPCLAALRKHGRCWLPDGHDGPCGTGE